MTQKTKYLLSKLLFCFALILFIPTLVVFIWQQCINIHLLKDGTAVVATMIRRDGQVAYYDIEYGGDYYVGTVTLSKSAMRRFRVGERVEALVLPGRIKSDKKQTILSHHKAFLRPLPPSQQDICFEKERIDSMYNYSSSIGSK